MPRDKTVSHAKIMMAAREEFLEMGFEKASMRRIGERCGMTAAAIYRHCRDKEDLFDQLVAPAVERLYAWMDAHERRYQDALASGGRVQWQDSEIDMMREVVLPNAADYQLLLTHAQGTKYEHFLHELTERCQQQMLQYMRVMKENGYPVQEVSPREMHLLLSAYTTALFEPVVHDYTPQEAQKCLQTVEVFFLPGWKKLMGF